MIGKKSPFEIQTVIANALYSDATLAALAVTLFGKAQTVNSGFDPKKPPQAAKLPWLTVALDTTGSNTDFNVVDYSFLIGAAVQIDPTQSTVSGVITYAELEKVYDYAEKIYDVVYNALLADSSENGYEIMSIGAIQYDNDIPFVNFYFNATASVELA